MCFKVISTEKIDLFGRKDISVFSERPKSIKEYFKKSVISYGDGTALIYKDQQLTYDEFDTLTDNIAANLATKYNIKQGDRVLTLLGNQIEFPLLLIAIVKIGAVMVPINTKLATDEISYIIGHAQPHLIIATKSLASNIHDITDEQVKVYCKNMVTLENSFDKLRSETDNEVEEVVVDEADPACILYTSGTTGKPKGAILTHINVIHSVMHYRDMFGINHKSRTIIAVPLFHVTGLVAQLLLTIFCGASSVILHHYRNEDYIEHTYRYRVNYHFNVPTMFIMMATSPLIKKYSFDFVEVVAFGGSTIYRHTLEELQHIFPKARLHNAYGATETTSPATIMPREYPLSKAASVGKPVVNGEIKIVDMDGDEVDVNVEGEILIKGPMVIPGYFNNLKANENEFIDGYWRSGDIGKIDEDGFVYVLDRMNDMINRGGENIFSIEVENVLKNHPAIKEVAVVGTPDDIYGEKVKAVIVSDQLTAADNEQLQSFCAKSLAQYKVPEVFEYLDELPKNASGKILKNKL